MAADPAIRSPAKRSRPREKRRTLTSVTASAGKEIAILKRHAENVTRINKTHDCASTVRHHSVDPQDAFQDIAYLGRLIAFPE